MQTEPEVILDSWFSIIPEANGPSYRLQDAKARLKRR